MKKVLIGCAIVVAALVVLVVVVAVVAIALGFTAFSSYSRAGSEHERDVLRRHAYEPAHAAALPASGTFVVFTGTHAKKITDDGRTITDSDTGTFFVDMDSPRLTLLDDPGDVTPASGDVIRRLSTPQGAVDVHADGTIHTAAVASTLDQTLPALSWRSPDGAWYAYVDLKRFENGAALVVVRADGSKENVVARDLTKRWGYTLVWSPDSKKLFVYEYDPGSTRDPDKPAPGNTIYVTSPDAKGMKKFYATPHAENDYLGQLLYVPSIDKLLVPLQNRIDAIDVATGKTSTLWSSPDPQPENLGYAILSPDTTKIAFRQSFSIRVVDVATGALVGTIAPNDGRRAGADFEFLPSSDRIVFTGGGNDDVVSHVSYSEMTSWTVANSYLYVAKTDGSDVRKIGDESIDLTLSGVVQR